MMQSISIKLTKTKTDRKLVLTNVVSITITNDHFLGESPDRKIKIIIT